jgi:hypothetical protein
LGQSSRKWEPLKKDFKSWGFFLHVVKYRKCINEEILEKEKTGYLNKANVATLVIWTRPVAVGLEGDIEDRRFYGAI